MSRARAGKPQEPLRRTVGPLAQQNTVVSGPEQARATLFFSRVSVWLAWVILLFGVFTAVSTALIVYKTFSPVIFWDQWTTVNDMVRSNGRPSLAQLWAPHNEHRIPFGRLACYADLKFFGGKNISLLIEIYIIQILESFVLIWMFRRYSGLNRAEVFTAAGFFIFCMFNPIQIENFSWGFEITYVLAPLAASVAIAAAVVHADLISSRDHHVWFSGALLLCLGASIVAELSLANGIFIWPVLLLLGLLLKVPQRTQYLIVSVGACAAAAYLWGFKSPGQHANPLQSLGHPIEIWKYVRTYLAWTWDPGVPSTSSWPSFTESSVTLAVGVVAVVLLRLIKTCGTLTKVQAFFLVNIIFVLITSVVTALGRINFGIQQATASRYQTTALVFWACLLGLVLTWLHAKSANPIRLVEIQVVLLFLVMASGARFDFSEKAARARQTTLAQAYTELILNPASLEARSKLSPYPNLAEAFGYLKAHNMGPVLRDLGVIQGSIVPMTSVENGQLKVNGFLMAAATQCAGYVDSVIPVPGRLGSVTAAGWAWRVGSRKPQSHVILALQDGTIVGRAEVSLPRPDVREKVPQVTVQETGWAGEAYLPPGATLRAFVVLDDSKSVCPLLSEFKQQ
jgi:hypothetical protein